MNDTKRTAQTVLSNIFGGMTAVHTVLSTFVSVNVTAMEERPDPPVLMCVHIGP